MEYNSDSTSPQSRHNTTPASKKTVAHSNAITPLVGLDGWLVFIQLQLWVGMVYMLIVLLAEPFPYSIISIVELILMILCTVYFYKRDIRFRTLYVIFTLLGIISSVLYLFSDYELVGDLGKQVIYAAIWITYLYKSVRVKNTFHHPNESQNTPSATEHYPL